MSREPEQLDIGTREIRLAAEAERLRGLEDTRARREGTLVLVIVLLLIGGMVGWGMWLTRPCHGPHYPAQESSP